MGIIQDKWYVYHTNITKLEQECANRMVVLVPKGIAIYFGDIDEDYIKGFRSFRLE